MMAKAINRNSNWSDHETEIFVQLYADHFEALESGLKRKPIFQKISESLSQHGFDRNAGQVAKKIANLRHQYSKKSFSPSASKMSSWMQAMHKILGQSEGKIANKKMEFFALGEEQTMNEVKVEVEDDDYEKVLPPPEISDYREDPVSQSNEQALLVSQKQISGMKTIKKLPFQTKLFHHQVVRRIRTSASRSKIGKQIALAVAANRRISRKIPGKESAFKMEKTSMYENLLPLRDELNHCFICYRQEETIRQSNFFNKSQKLEILPENMNVMFLLKKLFEFPSENLIVYLAAKENPNQWIGVCSTCRPLVQEVMHKNDKILKLLQELRHIREQIVVKVKETHYKVTEHCRVCERVRCNGHQELFITDEIRDFISKRKYDNINPFVAGDEKAKEKLMGQRENSTMSSEVNKFSDISSLHDLSPLSVDTDEFCDSDPDYSVTQHCQSTSKTIMKTSVGFDCSICQEEFQTQCDLKAHLNQVHLTELSRVKEANLDYSCPSCPNLKAMCFEAFIGHVIFHYKRPNKCTECSVNLPDDENVIEKHWNEFHSTSSNVSKYFKANLDLGKLWSCTHCKENFLTFEERDAHEKDGHSSIITHNLEDMSHECTICSIRFKTFEDWRLHRALEHPVLASTCCLLCDKSFAIKTKEGLELLDKRNMLKHIRESHQSTRLQYFDVCDFCGEPFRSYRYSHNLGKHLIEQHNVKESLLFSCHICSAKFEDKRSLSVHTKNVHYERKVKCEVCNFRAKSYLLLQIHKSNKHGIRDKDCVVYKCSHSGCPFESLSSKSIFQHKKQHQPFRQRAHICGFCGKSFFSVSHLRKHEKIHSNAETKPYQCEICGNSFALRNYLYIHKRLSHERRPFGSGRKKVLSK